MILLHLAETEPELRLLFGRKEIDIIKKQLEGLELTQSEKNRLSRSIRKKLECVQKLSQCADEFELKKGAHIQEIIDETVDIIKKDPLAQQVKAILLFGSFAKGEQTWRSDIDMCVLFEKEISIREATIFRKRILGSADQKCDVQVFSALPPKIRREIAKHHKVLFSRRNFDNLNFTIQTIKLSNEMERKLAVT